MERVLHQLFPSIILIKLTTMDSQHLQISKRHIKCFEYKMKGQLHQQNKHQPISNYFIQLVARVKKLQARRKKSKLQLGLLNQQLLGLQKKNEGIRELLRQYENLSTTSVEEIVDLAVFEQTPQLLEQCSESVIQLYEQKLKYFNEQMNSQQNLKLYECVKNSMKKIQVLKTMKANLIKQINLINIKIEQEESKRKHL